MVTWNRPNVHNFEMEKRSGEEEATRGIVLKPIFKKFSGQWHMETNFALQYVCQEF